jgi:hypothetical protein
MSAVRWTAGIETCPGAVLIKRFQSDGDVPISNYAFMSPLGDLSAARPLAPNYPYLGRPMTP